MLPEHRSTTDQSAGAPTRAALRRAPKRRVLAAAALVATALPATTYVVTSMSSASAATGSVSGLVFRDANVNGTKDVGEGGAADVWVKAFATTSGGDGILNTRDDVETAFGPTKTAADGSWSISSITSDTKVRVEFYGVDENADGTLQAGEQALPSWLKPGPVGVDNGSEVQLVALNASNVRYAVANPADYCQNNPLIVTACMTLGSNTTYDKAVVTMPASLSATFTSEATSGQVGAVNGLAYRRDGNIFAGTYVKRHTEYGSAGNVNAIYRMTAGGSDAPTVFTTLPGSLPAHESAKYISDDGLWTAVGKAGIGDVDISEDGSALYAVNMGDRQLYTVPINGTGAGVTAGAATGVAIASPSGCEGPRPMGLAVKDGLVYVGGVCSAETSGLASHVEGYVMVFNPGSSARVLDGQTIGAGAFGVTEVLRFSFAYPRKATYCSNIAGAGCTQRPWPAWNDSSVWTDGPMLSDLDFSNGDLVIGVRERLSDKAGNNAEEYGNNVLYQPMGEGDLLLACRAASGWALEGNGACTSTVNGVRTTNDAVTGGISNNQGPGGGEFFYDSVEFNPGNGHPDAAFGGVAVNGSSVIHTSIDPTGQAYTGGLNSVSAVDGTRQGGVVLQPNNTSFFGKANGLGDIELLCNEAPIEIGNRVWADANHDGIQNAGEADLAGVTVKLYASDGTTLLGTTTTASDGTYKFTSVGGTVTNTDNLVDTLVPATSYKIVIDTTQGSLTGYTLTTANQNDATVGDNSDSDATLNGTDAVVSLTTGSAGSNDDSFDIGFFTPYSLGNRVWFDLDDDGKIDVSEGGIAGRTVELLDASGAAILSGGNPVTTTTDSEGYYRFDGLVPGTYKVRTSAPAGYVSSTPDAASADNDVDATATTSSDDGLGTATTATSGVVTLNGTEPTGESDLVAGGNPQGTADDHANMTVDFGFHQPIDLAIAMALTTGGTIYPCQAVDYTVDARNNGPKTALSGFTVTVRLPTGLSWAVIAADGVNWTITGTNGQEVTLTYGGADLAAGAHAPVINVHATVDCGASGSLTAESKVIPAAGEVPETIPLGSANSGYETGDPNVGSNNDASAPLTITPPTTTTLPPTTTTLPPTTTTLPPTTTTLPVTTTTAPVTTTTAPVTTTTAPVTTTTAPVTTTTADPVTTTTVPPTTTTVPPTTTTVPPTTTTVPPTTTTVPVTTTTVPPTTTTAPPTTTTVPPTTTTAPPTTTTAPPTTTTVASTTTTTLAPTASLGDYVWLDENKNGIQDAGDYPVPLATVRLLDGNGALLATAVTDASGLYRFNGLTPGVPYIVEFVRSSMPGFVTGFTTMGVGGPTTDSNADPTTGRTMPVTLAPGEHNPTIDAGLIRDTTPTTVPVTPNPTTTTTSTPPTTTTSTTTPTATTVPVVTTTTAAPAPTTVAPTTTIPVPPGVIGDYVWKDFNGDGKQDPNEKPIVGAVLVLTCDKGLTLKAITDENGLYRFDGLQPDTCTVTVQSTSNPTNGPKARTVKLGVGESYLDADFGFNKSGVQGVQIEAPLDGLSVTGTPAILMAAMALLLISMGSWTLSRRRTRGRHAVI